jgi:hypothetical protein
MWEKDCLLRLWKVWKISDELALCGIVHWTEQQID